MRPVVLVLSPYHILRRLLGLADAFPLVRLLVADGCKTRSSLAFDDDQAPVHPTYSYIDEEDDEGISNAKSKYKQCSDDGALSVVRTTLARRRQQTVASYRCGRQW